MAVGSHGCTGTDLPAMRECWGQSMARRKREEDNDDDDDVLPPPAGLVAACAVGKRGHAEDDEDVGMISDKLQRTANDIP
jgi:hypothetical protein